MKILVVSDSHKRLEKLMKIYELERPEIVISAGDHSRDAEELSYLYPDSTYYIVRGNCDIFDRNYENEMVLNLGGSKILLAHGHEYDVKYSYFTIRKEAEKRGCDIVIFGHTHIPYLQKEDGVVLFNPGAVCNGEYGILEIIDGELIFSQKYL